MEPLILGTPWLEILGLVYYMLSWISRSNLQFLFANAKKKVFFVTQRNQPNRLMTGVGKNKQNKKELKLGKKIPRRLNATPKQSTVSMKEIFSECLLSVLNIGFSVRTDVEEEAPSPRVYNYISEQIEVIYNTTSSVWSDYSLGMVYVMTCCVCPFHSKFCLVQLLLVCWMMLRAFVASFSLK